MIKTDKRENFIKRLSTSRMKEKKQVNVTKVSTHVEKNIEIEKLFNGLKKKYTLGKSRDVQQLKMEFKKFYE